MKSREQINAEADQRVVDALLRARHLDTPESIDARMKVLRDQISSPVDSVETKKGRIFQMAIGGASAIAAVVMVSLILFNPAPVSAISLLEKAQRIELSDVSGDHRYRVTIEPAHGGHGAPPLEAILDVRDGRQLRFDLTQPNGTHHIWGLGPSGPWEKPPHREVKYLDETRWPKILEGQSLSLLIDTMPSLLDLVIKGYDAEDLSDNRIRATKRDPNTNGPEEILIDLNEDTGEVESLELRWNPKSIGSGHRPPGPDGKGPHHRRDSPRGGPPPDRFMPPPPNHLRDSGPRDRPGRPPHKGAKGPGSPFGHPGPVSPPPGIIRFERISSVDVPIGWFSGDSNK